LAKQTRVTFANLGITEPLALDEYQSRGGFKGLEAALAMAPEAIIQELKVSRLRGRGGAAFPVWSKWEVARQTEADEKYVVVNADEGDAGTYCDRLVMEGDPFRLIEGMLICAHATGANKGYIYCRQEYPAAAWAIRTAIKKADEAELLELDGRTFSIEVVLGAGAYVCGEETALLESLEGKRGNPRLKPPFPAVKGLYGCPTVVNNVETLASVVPIIQMGGDEYSKIGVGRSTGTKLISACGHINKPGVYEIELGLSVEEFLYSEEYCGGIANGKKLKAVIPGGSSVPILPAHLVTRTAAEAPRYMS
jgi:NADH:ubiquinone oxidoreductase subunit F (NADH-binding)